MAVALGPCRGPRRATQLRAIEDAIARYHSTRCHQCGFGHWHADRPALHVRLGRLVRKVVAR